MPNAYVFTTTWQNKLYYILPSACIFNNSWQIIIKNEDGDDLFERSLKLNPC